MSSRRDPLAPIDRAGRDPLGHASAHLADREPLPWVFFLVFLVGAALVVTAMWYHIEGLRRGVTARWRAAIETIADDRARLVDHWLAARRADAEVLAGSPAVRSVLWIKSSDDSALVRHLDQVAAAYGYTGIVIFDTGGHVVARSATAAPDAAAAEIALAVARTRKVDVEMVDDAPGRQALVVSAPVFATGTREPVLLGVVSLSMNPQTGPFRLLSENTPIRSDETLLFRLDPRDPVYLSPLRHASAGWAAVTRSVEALQELAGRRAFGEIADYRAEPVLAAVRPIPGTGWGLAFKVDRDEVMEEFNRAGHLTGAAGAFLLLALAGFLIAIWRQRQRARLLHGRVEHERAISNLRGYAEKIVASVPSGLLLLSADLVVLSVNPSFLETFRLREDEVLGHPLLDVIHADGLIRRARDVVQSGTPQRDVLLDLHLTARQETRPVVVTMTGIRLVGDEPARLLLIVQDLTEEERLQAARRASEERFRDLVEGLDAIVWEADAATLRFSFVSRRAESVLGYPVERWLWTADFFSNRIHPDDRVRVLQTVREAIARGVDHDLEYRALTADRNELWLRDIVHVVSAGAGRAAQLRGVTVDLTERKRAEEALGQAEDRLRQAQKMDAVGKLAGGIAHDFNNLLMVIRGEADLILRRLGPGDPIRQNADGIREASDQAAALTRQLLAFSRKQVLAPAVLDLGKVITGLQKILRRLIGETIAVETAAAPDLGHVKADPGQLEQMILNLAVNARDAMPDGGRLTIRAANEEVDAATGRRGGIAPGAYVMLEVSDTGVGMDAETRSHLFEPFFTTKAQGKGTGLGLSTVYGIVNQSGGHIAVETELGRGTTFRVYLPRTRAAEEPEPMATPSEPPAAPAPEAAERAAAPHGETILLVEDAKRVREVVREILETNGYEVLVARQGPEALRLSERHQGPIELMVTDVVMPQMSGRELAQRLAPLRPDMRVLYMSGYTDDAIVRHGVLDADIAFIAKPFTPDALAAKVRQILDAPPRSPGAPRSDDEAPAGRPGEAAGARRPSRA